VTIMSDIRFALRMLARRPGVPAVLAGLFALSVGMASGMWAVIDAVALRPLPYRDGHQLVVVTESHPERGLMAVTPANFLDWAGRVTTLQDATGLGSLEASIVSHGEPSRVIGTKVTERFFDLMGVPPARGRGLVGADFRADGRVAVDVSLSDGRYHDEKSQTALFDRLLSALAARPEIRAVAAANYIPPARIWGNIRFGIEGRSTATDAQTTLASSVSPGVFSLLGVSLLRGRLIDDRDHSGAPRVGVISAALARRYWPHEDPVGRRIALVSDPAPITIVGVVNDVRQPLSTDPRAESVLYLSYRQIPSPFMSILVVPAGGASPALAAVRQEVGRIDPAQAAGSARPIDEIRNTWLEQPRLRTRIVTLFGISTLLLTLVGLYARVAYAAASRMREFAIRQALGASAADVVRARTSSRTREPCTTPEI
jgi:hypothetical protein